ncbi:TIGR00153 family protein [Alkalilimnicola sp. S0819]|uniref:TIGR00153 family protein n=1 Tax=Alkalilimnicola sp. S0819 TaxID=2613922 RepID=UPI0012615B64|nr:TIGR00153 family protein [Alkalilimnicola sp. S0819]KAB7624402.1 TIGR00153 family protein [Alkalilimnicola sp. S0819]MPQ16229.1 TIGR00153 family protein [Alkalilimnicola sp. S0819]
MIQKSYFSGIFGSSPVKPLQQHMNKVADCVRELIPLFSAVARADYAEVARAQQRVAALEDEADEMKTELRLHLPNSLFMPVDRRDLLELLRAQDNIANQAKDIAGLVLGRKMSLPEAIREEFLAYLRRSSEAVNVALRVVNEFDELVEAGFRGSEVERVSRLLDELSAVEKDTDNMQIRIRAELQKLEDELPPVDVIFLYKIIEWTGKLADLSERVGSRLQLMLAK